MNMVFSNSDYRPLADGETYENKFVVLSLRQFKPEYQTAQCQLYYAMGGFGCDPTKLGGKVFGRLFDTDEAIEAWEREYGISCETFLTGDLIKLG